MDLPEAGEEVLSMITKIMGKMTVDLDRAYFMTATWNI
jgi:hypothetical protein